MENCWTLDKRMSFLSTCRLFFASDDNLFIIEQVYICMCVCYATKHWLVNVDTAL